MSANTPTNYDVVTTRPTKRFFVEMLTRDINVHDAILDLLDNCVDGILRSISVKSMEGDTPYDGFWAKITVNKDSFEIRDNCGGIPWELKDSAFRLGRPKPDSSQEEEMPINSVGVYGIGLKRAIFKMGDEALILTQNGENSYGVLMPSEWMHTEDNWELNVEDAQGKLAHDGTTIIVNKLHDGISQSFGAEKFKDELLDKIQGHYAVIIDKGFRVEVNGVVAQPKPVRLKFAPAGGDPHAVRPYVFTSELNGVEVFLTIGLRQAIPSAEDVLDAQRENTMSSELAGWTIICNDRVVLYRNKDELTGWGTSGIPRYHTQFIAISGVVEFRGDASKLPTTTTKRGLDLSSPLYQQVLNKMRDGMRIFINFTNDWKTRDDATRKGQVLSVPSLGYEAVKEQAKNLIFTTVKAGLGGGEGKQFSPKLPEPPKTSTTVRVSFYREESDVTALAEELLSDFESLTKASDIRRQVGEVSFDRVFEEVMERKPTSTDETE